MPSLQGCKGLQADSISYSFNHSFIHSFIIDIYIAPLQGYYSAALPIPARLKRTVSRLV